MSSLQLLGYVLFVLMLWRVIKRLLHGKSPLAHVSGPAKDHWLKGNYHRIFKDGWDYNMQLVKKYGGAVKIHALLGDEQLYVSDPLALYYIVVKEQHIYEETDMFIMTNKAIFGEGLVSTLGEQHKKQRKILNPVFSLSSMRDILPAIQPIANKLCTVLVSQLPSNGEAKEINVLQWMSRGSLEYICQAAFGYSFDALDASKTNEYTEAIGKLGTTILRLLLLRPFVPFLMRNFSLYWRKKMVDWSPIPGLRDMKGIVNIMHSASKTIVMEKKAEIEHGEVKTHDETGVETTSNPRSGGQDIIGIMLRANSASSEAERLTEAEILGQMNTFILAGFETTATAISRTLHILAERPQVQARLRSEIRKAKLDYLASNNIRTTDWKNVELPYDNLMSLPFLDAVIRETLRVYPPTSLLSRTARKATVLPLQYPVRSVSGAELSSISVPANTTIIMSILAANHNQQVWGEDASEWKPERWLTSSGERIGMGKEANGTSAPQESPSSGAEGAPGTKNSVRYPGVYASTMTFLGGGRACIGFKFAEMEIKQVITTLLPKLHISLLVDENGSTKKIYWKMDAAQVPVVRPPAGDNQTPQVPLSIRLVRDDDFM